MGFVLFGEKLYFLVIINKHLFCLHGGELPLEVRFVGKKSFFVFFLRFDAENFLGKSGMNVFCLERWQSCNACILLMCFSLTDFCRLI